MAVPDEPGLADVARRVAAGTASVRTLHEVFLVSTVLCEAAEAPGFVAVGPVGAGLVPVFTSEAQLARARGPVVWFATTGADLLGLVPAGYDLVLDPAGEAPLRLHLTALRASTMAAVGWG